MKRACVRAGVAAIILGFFSTAFAAPSSELKISSDGTFMAQNIVVMQKADTNLFARGVWGNAFVRLTILTSPVGVPAKITKKNGGIASVAVIREGDILSVEGSLAQGADYLLVNAKSIQDLSLLVEEKRVSGSVHSVNYGARSFALTDKVLGVVTVYATSSAKVTKGARTLTVGEIVQGDRVLSASGTYDYTTHVLNASAVELHQDQSVFAAKNFQGTLKSLSGTTLPASLTVAVGDTTYTVYLSAKDSVMSKNRTPVSLTRFVAGDTGRFYGSVRKTDLKELDAIILRDLNY